MWEDGIVEEVRQVRIRHAQQFGFDLWAIYQDLKDQERSSERKVVRLSPRKRRHRKASSKVSQSQTLGEPQIVN